RRRPSGSRSRTGARRRGLKSESSSGERSRFGARSGARGEGGVRRLGLLYTALSSHRRPIRFRPFVLPLVAFTPASPVDALGRRDCGESGVCRPICTGVADGVLEAVLIVDDEPHVVGVLLEFFARFQHGHAYDVVPAYSAAEALDILLRRAFDLILLDMIIPGMGDRWKQGLDLLKRIRDLGVKAPILMMSGDGFQKAEALMAGGVGDLHKPFNIRDLDRSVALAVGPRTTGG